MTRRPKLRVLLAAGTALCAALCLLGVAASGGSAGAAVTGGAATFTLTPGVSELTPGRPQQFSATSSVTWAVDGVTGGNASTGTITSGGLYTAPSGAGTHTVTATSTDGTQAADSTVHVGNDAGTFTFHNDNMRTGENLGETSLSLSNVNSSSFGKLFSLPLDGQAIASPLYVRGVSVPSKGVHDFVYVATEHDSVYAYDADSGSTTPLWKDSFIDPSAGVTTVPPADTGEVTDIAPEIGITSTPVIDPSTNTIYVVAKTKEVSGGGTSYVQRLHALDIATGAEKFGGPVVIQGSVPGNGVDAAGGKIAFNPLRENQRTGLTLLNGRVYFGFSSHGDHQPYHGWIFGYDAKTLQRTLVWSSSPDTDSSGIWGAGGAIASDGTDLIFDTGDGPFDANTGGRDYGDTYIRLSTSGTVKDYFAPLDQADDNAVNHDLGSGGMLLLPDQPGPHPHLMVSAGKDHDLFVVNRDDMGTYNGSTDTSVQSVNEVFAGGPSNLAGNFGAPVYWNGWVFFGPATDTVAAFRLTGGSKPFPTSPTLRSAASFPLRGATLAISSDGPSNDGILWAVAKNGDTSPGVLYAYDPAGSTGGVLRELWDSNQAGSRDTDGPATKFSIPLVDNGRVYAAGFTQVTVYGLLAGSSTSHAVTGGGGGGGGGSGGGGSGGGGGVPPDLRVSLTASSTTAPTPGSGLNYVVTVSSGNVGASSDARLSLTLPGGYTVTSTYADRGPGCTGTAPNLTCDVAWITPTTSSHVTIVGTVGQTGEQDATATVTSLVEPEANPADNTVTLTLLPARTGGVGGVGRTLTAVHAPVVKGIPTPGNLLRATPPVWSVEPDRVTFAWQLCGARSCVTYAPATGRTLRVQRAWVGKSVRFVATATSGTTAVVSRSNRVALRRR